MLKGERIGMKVSKSNAEHYKWGNNCDGWNLLNQKDISVIHERMPANTAEVRHYHSKTRQFFFVLSGSPTMEVDGERFNLNMHEGIEIPPFVPHQIVNESSDSAEFLVISQPKSRGDRTLVPMLKEDD